MDFSDLEPRVRKCLRARSHTVGAYLQYADEDDLVGDCLLSIWRQVSAKEYSPAGLRSLVWLTCRSALADHAEKGKTRGIVEVSDDLDLMESAADAEPVDNELPDWCLEMAGDLAPTAIVVMGCESKADAAEILGCGRTTVYSRLKKLRERFASVDPAAVPDDTKRATVEPLVELEPVEPAVELAPESPKPARSRRVYREAWQPLEKWETAPLAPIVSVEPSVPLWCASRPIGAFGRDSGPVAARRQRGQFATDYGTARPPPAVCLSISA